MVSLLHEALLLLLRNQPTLAAHLLRGLAVKVPGYHAADVVSSDFSQPLPVEARADGVILLYGDARKTRPVFAVVVEVQLKRNADKRRKWPLYHAAAAARFDCPACVLVIAANDALATWCARPIIGPGYFMTPFVVGPRGIPVVDSKAAVRQAPELAVMSTLLQARNRAIGADRIKIVLETMMQEPSDTHLLYLDVVWHVLDRTMKTALEALMPNLNQLEKSPFRLAIERSHAEGEAKGEANALLLILAARGIAIPEAARQQILACSDRDTLGRWIERAAVASKISDVIGT